MKIQYDIISVIIVIYIYMYTYTQTDIYIYIYAHTHTYIYIYRCIYIHIDTYNHNFHPLKVPSATPRSSWCCYLDPKNLTVSESFSLADVHHGLCGTSYAVVRREHPYSQQNMGSQLELHSEFSSCESIVQRPLCVLRRLAKRFGRQTSCKRVIWWMSTAP